MSVEKTEDEVKEFAANAARNEWGKTFKLGEKEFEIKDLPYFDYIEFIGLAKPLIVAASSGINKKVEGGEMGVNFDPSTLDYDELIRLAGKELPKMGFLICRQTDPKIKETEVALLAHRPQRLLEIVLLQVYHNKMVEEFAGFFQRLAGMMSAMIPDVAKAQTPLELTVEETHSS